MASNTLSIGSANYELLDSLQATVTKTGVGTAANFMVKSKPGGTSIDNLGLDNSESNENLGVAGNSNISIFSSLNNFEATLAGGNDTLNIFGTVSGTRIELDTANTDDLANTDSDYRLADGGDSLNINGNLFAGVATDRNAGDGNNDINRIYAGAGNDTIRIAGLANDAFIYLGDGKDSLSVNGQATNLDVKAGAGNDAITFNDIANNVSVSGGSGNDTVIFNKTLSGDDKTAQFISWPSSPEVMVDSDSSSSGSFFNPSINLGDGNDSLILGGGTSGPVAINTGSGYDSTQLKGSFDSAQFILHGASDSLSLAGSDKITASPNASFYNSEFISANTGGDTLIFSNGTLLSDSSINLGNGNDSIVFGSNSTLADSLIRTDEGSDTIVFGASSSLFNTTIDLGSDTDFDQIKFANQAELSGVTVTGGSVGDTLWIGGTAYAYDSGHSDFYNGMTLWKA